MGVEKAPAPGTIALLWYLLNLFYQSRNCLEHLRKGGLLPTGFCSCIQNGTEASSLTFEYVLENQDFRVR
jgi:hypothetical protein